MRIAHLSKCNDSSDLSMTTGYPRRGKGRIATITTQLPYRLRKTHRISNLHKARIMCQGDDAIAYGFRLLCIRLELEFEAE